MTFLNWSILIGILAIAIPIIIHLFSRRKPKPVKWAAMIFLTESLRSSSRRILFEEVILMSLRCLLVATLVLAAARPFIPVSSNVPWSVVLPAILLAGLTAGACGASWKNKKHRWSWAWTTLTLLLIALGATVIEHFVQKSKWASGGLKDITIILDGSDSMRIKGDGNISSFEKAVTNATTLIEKCKGSDAVSIVLAGPEAQNIIETPISDKGELLACLEDIKPIGGRMNISDALIKACSNLERGTNPVKRIAIFTDAQKLGWDTQSSEKWNHIASAMEMLESKPKIICQPIPVDVDDYSNLGITLIQPSNPISAVNLTQNFNVRISNSGELEIPPVTVRFKIDGRKKHPLTTSTIYPGSHEMLSFQHKFTTPGMHRVTAEIDNSDSQRADNIKHSVVNVLDRVSVLLIDGGPDSGAKYIEMALCPADLSKHNYLITPTRVSPAKFASMSDLEEFHMVILADVERLPFQSASLIGRFVRDGGGLLVMPGQNSKKDFYNTWVGRFRKPLMPAVMEKWNVNPEKPLSPSADSFDKSILSLIANDETSGINRVLVRAWWKLKLDSNDMDTSVRANFNDSSIMLARRKYGKGIVLMNAFSVDPLDSTFARHGESFVPFINEIVQHLIDPQADNLNIYPGQPVLLTLERKKDEPVSLPKNLNVITPDDKNKSAKVSRENGAINISFDQTVMPGLYKINLGQQLADDLADTFPDNSLLLNVQRDPREDRLEVLTETDFQNLSEYVEIFRAEDFDQIQAAMSGNIPGKEIWRAMACLALFLIFAEALMTRLIFRNA